MATSLLSTSLFDHGQSAYRETILFLPLALHLTSLLLLLILLIISIIGGQQQQQQQHQYQQSRAGSDKLAQPVDGQRKITNSCNGDIKQHKSAPSASSSGDHITWPEYFMAVAQLAAKRSKDPSTKVGACIVNEQNKIVATGYNGMPNGINDKLVPWTKEGSFYDTKYAYVVHAELNAILNSVLTDQTGCRIFVSLFPCNECAKAIIQTGIKHVIYLSDKHSERESTRAAKRMFKIAGVYHEQFSSSVLI